MHFDLSYQKPGSSRFKLMIDGNMHDIDLVYTFGDQAEQWNIKVYLGTSVQDVKVVDFVNQFPYLSQLIYDLLLMGKDPNDVTIHYF